ncbi:esterase-like activity of phytase family protein [Actinacidiphila yeochonensis]|uniref:esterase-like activity of phytase family protein n=1 Tax=Actinacidiphila yeochonensis TaxID=89050 RepID=UPI0005606106|nr:esterase-like activity of phytase family protein [Actinacidiphila yeochonensis]
MSPSSTTGTRPRRAFGPRAAAAACCLAAAATIALPGATASARTPAAQAPASSRLPQACGTAGWVDGYSDALNKLPVGDETVGDLSALTWDARRHAYASVIDHATGRQARLWFFTDPANPRITGTLVLRKADGTPYDDTDFDAEGLTVLPNGDYLVSSEVEPSIREFGRDGVQRGELTVPARFRVAPAGEATSNATLEGLSVSPDGRYVYAAMEGVLSGDVSSSGNADDRRILVYQADGRGGYRLVKEVGYRLQPGNRISEVAAYGPNGLLVLEAAWSAAVGNTIAVYAAPDALHAPDVSKVGDLGDAPAPKLAGKVLVAAVDQCPSLGAIARETQQNPLMDNYEGMAIEPGPHPLGLAGLVLVSDDNSSTAQTTRLLRLTVRLPSHLPVGH